MLSSLKVALVLANVALQAPDTATVRLHISKMTCGSCPATARLALKRLTGVYSATVTRRPAGSGHGDRSASHLENDVRELSHDRAPRLEATHGRLQRHRNTGRQSWRRAL